MTMTRLRGGLLLALAACGVLASPAAAYWVVGTQEAFLYGCDQYGNPDSSNGTYVRSAKVFKDSNTGILVLLACGKVTNDSGRFCKFEGQGPSIWDPETESWYTATRDIQYVCKNWCWCRGCSRCSNVAASVLVACYNPQQDDGYSDGPAQ
jgi:hypothetical protein